MSRRRKRKPMPEEIKSLPVTEIIPNLTNVNVMAELDLNDLVKKIHKRGFDQPLKVWWNEELKKYEVIKGNHRFEAAKYLGLTELPCIIGKYESRDDALLDGMSDNIIRGKIDPDKFSSEWVRLKGKYGTDKIMEMMAMSSQKNLDKLIRETRSQLPDELKKKFDEAKKDIKNIDELAATLKKLSAEYGQTLEIGFMFFPYGGKMNLMIPMDKKLKEVMEKLGDVCIETKVKMQDILYSIVVPYLLTKKKKKKEVSVGKKG